jgi:tRNA A37 threonylcarbamoyladenosine synthetase subunit TsaC/SUA5/YrdC
VEWLRAGKIVAYPTDTLYGLAVDPASDGLSGRCFS